MLKDTFSFSMTSSRRGAWLMSALVLLPVLLLPRSSVLMALGDRLHLNNFFFSLLQYYPQLGGIITQWLYVIHLVKTNDPATGQYLAVLVLICLTTLSLTLCTAFFWRRMVDRAAIQTRRRMLLAVMAAVGSSLLLTCILSVGEFMIVARFSNAEGTVLSVLISAIYLLMAQLLYVPILLLAGMILLKREKGNARQVQRLPEM